MWGLRPSVNDWLVTGMAKSAAMRRLELILFDVSPEEYGPKLFRLNRKDQDYILGRIDRGENAQVTRREILRLDKQRIANARERRQARKAPVIDINVLRQRAYDKMRRSFNNSHPHRVKRNLSYATNTDLEYIIESTPDEIRAKAADRGNIRTYEDDDIELNVFWYK